MRLFDGLIDRNTVSILRHFVKNSRDIFHITQVSQLTGVSPATTFRIINRLVRSDILEIQRISKMKVYRLKITAKTKIFMKNPRWLE